MVNPSWYGEPESEKLEYKSFGATKNRETIVRAVVALLNHHGGHVVVGVDDDGHPEPSPPDLSGEIERVQMAIVDTIEPRPLELVEVRGVDAASRRVIEIAVRKGPSVKRPYAERRKGLYGFWIRSGPTTRALTAAEVREAWASTRTEDQTYQRWDASLEKSREIAPVFVLEAQLGGDTATLDRSALDRVFAPDRRRILAPRSMGWTVVDEYDRVERAGPDLVIAEPGARKWLRCDVRHGRIRFEARMDFLRWKAPPTLANEPVLYPFPIVEGTASFFRLLATYGDEVGLDHGRVRCSLGLWRPQGLRLGPHRPGTIAWDFGGVHWQPAHDNTNVERTDDVAWSVLRESSDRVARTFVTHVYEDFGYDERHVPFWSDADSRFVFAS